MLDNYDNKSFDCRYTTLFESVNAGAFLIDLDGKIIEANQKSCWLLGYCWDELINTNINNIFPKSADWPQIYEEIISKGGKDFESENIQKNGKIIPVSVNTSLFKMDEKPVMLVLIWDITERKKAEKQLKESEEKYEGLFECTIDGMIVLDARGEIIDINNKALELLCLDKENTIGNNFLNMGLLTPKSLSIVVNQFQELLSKRIATSQETEIINKNGLILYVELSSFFLIKKDNQIDFFVLIIRDISDRKKTELKLAYEHELLRTLMDSTSDVIYFKDDKNKYIMVNKAKAAQFNIKSEEIIGKTDFEILPESQAKQIFDEDEEVIKTGKFIINRVEKITNDDGTKRWISNTKIPRFNSEGSIIGLIGISRDITEWKRLEEEYGTEIKNHI